MAFRTGCAGDRDETNDLRHQPAVASGSVLECERIGFARMAYPNRRPSSDTRESVEAGEDGHVSFSTRPQPAGPATESLPARSHRLLDGVDEHRIERGRKGVVRWGEHPGRTRQYQRVRGTEDKQQGTTRRQDRLSVASGCS